MTDTPNLALPLLAAAQAQKHVTVNEALLALDAVVQLSVKGRSLAAPPGGAVDGDRYLVAGGASGAWAGHDLDIAVRLDGAWTFLEPRPGWHCWVEDEAVLLLWRGAPQYWSDYAAAAGLLGTTAAGDGTLARVGVNTAADATNRLAVKADAVLLSHDDVTPGTGDMRVTLNKSAAAKDAGFVFQTGWSTRALFGLLADDHFTVKVSPDGASFRTALTLNAGSGLAYGARGGAIPAVQASLLTADRAGANVATAQTLFGASEDTIALEAGTTYEFEAEYWITRASGTTSHTTGVLFGGTASLTSIGYLAQVTNPTGNALAAVQQIWGAAATLLTLTAANTSATENLLIKLKGRLRTSSAGTLIPQFQYSAAPGGAPTIKANSAFRIWPVGASTAAKIGDDWS